MGIEKELIARFKADVSQFLASVEKIQGTVPEVKKGFAGMNMSSGEFFKTLLAGTGVVMGASAAIQKTIEFVKEGVQKYLEEKRIVESLNSTIRIQGDSVKIVGRHYQDFAKAIEATVGIQDEQVLSMIQVARVMGIQKDMIEDTIKGAIGLSTEYEAFGLSAESAIRLISRAYEGSWGGLQKMIPELTSAGTETERMTILTQKMAEGYAIAVDRMKGEMGKFKDMKTEWADLKETVGGFFVGLAVSAKRYWEIMTGHHDRYKEMMRGAVMENDRIIAKQQAAYVAAGGIMYSKLEMEMKGIDTKWEEMEKGRAQKEKEYQQKRQKTMREISNEIAEEEHKALIERGKRAEEVYKDWLKDYLEIQEMMSVQGAKGVANRKNIFDVTLDSIKAMGSPLEKLKVQTSAVTDTNEKAKVSYQETAAKLKLIADAAASVRDLLGELGIETGGVVDGMVGMASGAAAFASSLKSGDIAGMIQGAATALKGFVQVLKAAFGGDGVGEAIQRENAWMNLTKEQTDKLRELEKQYKSTHAATSAMFGELVESAEITNDNFDQWAVRLHEIIADFDQGRLTGKKFTDAVGAGFTSLITKAQQLGTTGGKELISLFEDLADRGLKVAEIQKYMAEQIKIGLEGYKDYLAGGFSSVTIDVYEKIIAYQKKVADNQGLIDGIRGARDAMMGLSNVQQLTQEQFSGFGQIAVDAYNKLIGAGFTAQESLGQLAPYLAKMVYLNKEYGLAIDDGTQALIDQAEQNGINLEDMKTQEEIWGDISDNIGILVDLFKNAFPNAVKDGLDTSARYIDDWRGQYGNGDDWYSPPTPPIPEQGAATGFNGTVVGPRRFYIEPGLVEHVSIQPNTTKTGSDGAGIQYSPTFNFYDVSRGSANEIARKVKEAAQDDLEGIRATLRSVL